MIQLVSFERGKFGFEFVDDEAVSLGAVSVIKNQGMPR